MAKRLFHWSSVLDCVMHETDGDGNTLVTYAREPVQYGPLISEHRNGHEYVHHYDALGSTTMLTDETGSVTDTFTYDAWGNQVARTGTTDTPYRWVGRWGYQYDEATGGYYVRARVYQPMNARWESADPFYQTQLLLSHAYSRNSPVFVLDPSGLSWTRVVSTTTWCSDKAGDSLQDLAAIVSGHNSDWVCIWPVGSPAAWRGAYPRTATPCACADVDNLVKDKGPKPGQSSVECPDFKGFLAYFGPKSRCQPDTTQQTSTFLRENQRFDARLPWGPNLPYFRLDLETYLMIVSRSKRCESYFVNSTNIMKCQIVVVQFRATRVHVILLILLDTENLR